MLAFYKRRGVRMIIYATREMSEHVTEEYSGKFNLLKSSLTSQEDQLEKLAIAYEVNLNILGIVGFKEELKPDALDFI
jgi:phospholipid-translocating ATPase